MKICIFFLSFVVLISTVSSFSKIDLVKNYLEYLRVAVDGIIERSGGNTKCAKDLRTFISDLSRRKMWALKMLDASAKIQPGLLQGNVMQVGHYDECLAIDNENGIKGQYCSVVLLPSQNYSSKVSAFFDARTLAELIGAEAVKKNDHMSGHVRSMKLVFGICIPQSCSMETLQDIFGAVEHFFKSPVQTMFVDVLCDYKGKPLAPYSFDKYVYLFFGFVLLVVALSTAYDLLYSRKNNDDDPLVAFSLNYNMKKLLNTHSNENTLTCLSGVKVLSMLWVLQGHRFLVNAITINVNPIYMLEWRAEWISALIYSATFAVDTFFTLSGMLVMYSKLRISERVHVSLINFYLFRYIRLTPALAATILFYLSVFKHTSAGPAWPMVVWKVAGSCYKTWWGTLFHISNYIPTNSICVEQSWYLGVDTQLYMLAPIAVYNINKHPKKTLWSMALFCVVSMTYVFVKTYVHELGTVPASSNNDFFKYYYFSTFARSPPFVLGLFLGYFAYKNTHVSYTINKNLNLFFWILAIAALLGPISATYLLMKYDDYNALHSALYNGLARPIWSLGICWIIFSCVTGNGGYVDVTASSLFAFSAVGTALISLSIANRFLSASIFIVMSKLTYSAFLIHLWCMLMLNGSQKTQMHFNNVQSFHDLAGDIIFVTISSTVLCLMFESPLLTLMKIGFKRHVTTEMKRKSLKTSHKETNTDFTGFTTGKLWIYFTNRKSGNVKVE